MLAFSFIIAIIVVAGAVAAVLLATLLLATAMASAKREPFQRRADTPKKEKYLDLCGNLCMTE